MAIAMLTAIELAEHCSFSVFADADRRSALSYVTKDAKERLAKLTGWICPITKETAEMNLQHVIEVAHVVRKSLSGDHV
jgi:hypothetical protein